MTNIVKFPIDNYIDNMARHFTDAYLFGEEDAANDLVKEYIYDEIRPQFIKRCNVHLSPHGLTVK